MADKLTLIRLHTIPKLLKFAAVRIVGLLVFVAVDLMIAAVGHITCRVEMVVLLVKRLLFV